LIVSDDDAEGAEATGCEVRSYRGFSVEPIDAIGGASSVLADVAGRRRIAVEAGRYRLHSPRVSTGWMSARSSPASARSRTPTSCR